MTDYYPLIVRAVAGLEKNTGDARRGLYERARTALVAQLRGLNPPLTESEITRERLALEEAIRKVEAEASRKNRPDARPENAEAKPDEPPKEEVKLRDPLRMGTSQRKVEAPAPAEKPAAERERAAPATNGSAAQEPEPELKRPPRPRSRERAPQNGERARSEPDMVADSNGLGGAVAEPAKSPRPGPPPPQNGTAEHDGVEVRALRPAARDANRRLNRQPAGKLELQSDEPLPSIVGPGPRPRLDKPEESDAGTSPQRGSSFTGFLIAALCVLVALALAGTVFWQRDRIRTWFARAPTQQAQQSAPPTQQTKLPDRVTQGTQSATTGGQNEANVPAVAQRVVLYEEDPADAQGKRYVGSVIWRTETVSPSAGQTPELEVRSDLEIPDRRITMTMALRRNTDKSLPASHTIEIMFNLPADFPFGGISNVPGILMKQAEQTRGAPLAGLAVKVTSGFFLVGLSSTDADMQRNLQLLKERSWFDIPIVYNNGRRAILAVEKGTPGERAFSEAFAAWGE